MRRGLAAALASALCLALTGCAQQLGPDDVADRFWRAVVTGHAGKIRRYVMSSQRSLLEGDPELMPVANYRLGRIVIDGGEAMIETAITLDSDTPLPLDIDTRLVLEQDEWRVDYEATIEEISVNSDLARVISQIGAIGDTLKDGIEQSVEEMTRALPAIEKELADIEQDIKQAIPELREKLEAFSRRLEEALEAPPAPQDEPRPAPPSPDGTIAL